tara:strand:- start:72 stop:680 length:609 start_codon:yes stop_codon:yes gene_type:complete
MARALNFRIGKKVFDLIPLKLERKKLYGWSESLITDLNDDLCIPLKLLQDKSILIPKGGTGLGVVDNKGNWVDKSQMIYVNEEGNPADLVPSSFDEEIELNSSVSIEFLLEHNITSIYSLQGEENHPDFVEAVAKHNQIFSFIFNYRADYEGDPAFLIENEGELFVLVGKKIEFEYIGLEGAGTIDEVNEDEMEDELDFSMM